MLQQMDAPSAAPDGQWQGFNRVVTQHTVQLHGRTFIVEEVSFEQTSDDAETERLFNLMRPYMMTTFRPESNHSCKRARVSASGDAILALKEARAGDAGTPAECAVCLLDFVAEDRLREMPCSHTFHQDCIFRWLRINHVCPLCRHQLPTQQQDDDEDENYLQDYFDQQYRRYYGDDIEQYFGEQIYQQESLPVPEDSDAGNYEQDGDDRNSRQESMPVPEDP
ncbi:hypothetical protein HU200_030349 [Digitaria exilis]|uniref:RING-type domain-containing protein n=1 Tax=Digitaria exilis TaxID=1010633 RepID=A0A835C0C1_9POAL|nr:hypothetical protein HU200_030349 [Digitaria exilis]